MIISNLMTLSRIHPEEIYKWFMEMFIDSSEWVMVPNVFGMGTFADGGIFATKPYSCGSNYLLKMSNYKKGPWCDVVDGLYWQFMSDNRDFFASNPRLSILPRSLDRMKPERKKMIFNEADNFINLYTSKWKTKKLKFVKFVINHSVGEKNGKGIGKMSFIVQKNAEEIKKLVNRNYYFPN